jgi:hypothetical protein
MITSQFNESLSCFFRNNVIAFPVGRDKKKDAKEGGFVFPKWSNYKSPLSEADFEHEAEDIKKRAGEVWGIAVKCTNGLEILDFDLKHDPQKTVYSDFCTILKQYDPGLFAKVAIQATKSGGYHFWYYCPDSISPNIQLAKKAGASGYCIETRGNGGIAFVHPSPGYEVLQGGIDVGVIPTITKAEKELLHAIAISLNELQTKEPEKGRGFTSGQKIQAIVDQVQSSGINFLDSYQNWFLAAQALANEFGEAGRGYFHALSQYHPGYSREDSDKKFTNAIQTTRGNIGFATIADIASRQGIKYAETLAGRKSDIQEFANVAKRQEAKSGGSEPQSGKALNEYLDKINSQSNKALQRGKIFKHKKPPFVYIESAKGEKTGIVKANQVTTIQGGYGTHKSRIAETLAALLISEPTAKGDFLGFRKNISGPGNIVLYIDTERETSEELPEMVYNVHRIAGYEPGELSRHFILKTIADAPREIRLQIVKELVRGTREEMKSRGIHDWNLTVVLDVITDCVRSFNDEKEALGIFDFLKTMIDDTNVSIVAVIHENPGGTGKARGHIGTEAWNKSSVVMALAKESEEEAEEELFRCNFLKTRGYKTPSKLYFKWDKKTSWIVPADTPKKIDLDVSQVWEDVKHLFEHDGTADRTILKEAIKAAIKQRKEPGQSPAELNKRVNALHAARVIFVKEKGRGNRPDIFALPYKGDSNQQTDQEPEKVDWEEILGDS